MPVPILKPTSVHDEMFAGVTYHVEGELVPVLHLELSAMPVYFEHHILLWKDPQVQIGVKKLAGAFKRVISGMPIVMVQAGGPGQIGFSRDGAGHVFGMHLQRAEINDRIEEIVEPFFPRAVIYVRFFPEALLQDGLSVG